MTKTDLSAALRDAISSVLETMFFSSLEFVDKYQIEDWRGFERICACRLNFKGPLCGYLTVLTPDRTLGVLTADFMGLEKAQVTVEHLQGALSELANMITGDVFSRHDPEGVYQLELPRLITAPGEIPGPEKPGMVRCHVRTLNGPVEVQLGITNSEL